MSRNTKSAQAPGTAGINKTALATSISILVGGFAAPSTLAALPTGATLSFTLGAVTTVACKYGTAPPCAMFGYNITDIVGSYFSMDSGDPDTVSPNEKFAIGSFNGIAIGSTQLAAASHSGSVNGTEVPDIDNPWTFFGNTGMHQTTRTTSVATEVGNTITLSLPWSVNWNGNSNIPMVEKSTPTLTCDTTSCTDTSSYTLDAAYHVAGAGFTSVAYTLHLEGNISLPGNVPIANDDTTRTIAGNPRVINVTSNDSTSAEDPLTENSVAIATGATNGTANPNVPGSNVVTYTPATSFVGADTFVYTVDNLAGTSLTTLPVPAGSRGSVSVDVQTNVAPFAGDDTGKASTQQLDKLSGSLPIDALLNDSDVNNDPGLPGGIDVTTVEGSVINAAGNIGTCTGNADGTITYSQPVPSVATTDSCTYTVKDIDTSSAGPETSNSATVTITVNTSDWPVVVPAGVIPLLAFEPGQYTVIDDLGKPDQSVKPDKSWFSMQVSAKQLIYTAIEPGPDGGLIIGYDQPASGSHTGKPDESEQPGYSAPWVFFSNTGFDLTRNGGISNGGDGTLNFKTRYVVTWNSIAVINLGGSSKFPGDLGFANIICSDKPCQDGSTYVLDYEAHVDDIAGLLESGFDGVPYGLHQEGTVRFIDGNLKTSSGTIASETRLAANAVPPDTDDPNTEEEEGIDLQCVGSCFDYTIDGVAAGSTVSIVLPIAGGVPNFPVWRVLDNGVWRDFVTSATDNVKTAPFVAGGPGMECPSPGNGAYIDLVNDPLDLGLRPNVGHQCVQLTITDDGPNDLNKTPGIIEDPGGLGTSGAPDFVDTRSSGTSGCSIATTPVTPNRRADWWLLTGLLGWLGWNRRRNHAAKHGNISI